MKKLIVLNLIVALILSLGGMGFADDQRATFTKVYNAPNIGSVSPEDTFEFEFTADRTEDTATVIAAAEMPELPNVSVSYTEGEAGSTTASKLVEINLDSITWPSAGVYIYKIKEVQGTTAGVEYTDQKAYLKVTVAYQTEAPHAEYYVAFVSVHLDDTNENGITDGSKTGTATNTYYSGSLKVAKHVSGNLGNRDQYFKVTVTLTGAEGKNNYLTSYVVTGGSKIENGNDPCQESTITMDSSKDFFIKHGETIEIKNLPYGVTYTIEEDDYTTEETGGYTTTYSFDDANKAIDTASDTVTITNTKGVTIDTGIFLDSLPYILILAVVAAGGALLMIKRRRAER